MGTELLRHGASLPLELLNIDRPSLVSEIHSAYRAAGADILTTNTFGGNRFRLASHELTGRIRELNLAGARLAHNHADGALVAGSIGPSGLRQLPDEEDLREGFGEQAAALEEGGVDLFTCETFGDVRELRAAVLGISRASTRPIIAQMTYMPDGRTPAGQTPAQVVQALSDLNINAIGVNCAVGKDTVERVMPALRQATDLPLSAFPNAGEPHLQAGATHYPLDPGAFTHLAQRLRPLVTILGGCCGTTPAHIRALRSPGPM